MFTLLGNKKAGRTGFLVWVWHTNLLAFRQSLDALGAKALANQILTFAHSHRLNVRVELTTGRAHREAALITKLRLLATSFTHSHRRCCLSFAESGIEMLP